MPGDLGYQDYCLQRMALANEVGTRSRDLYSSFCEQLREVGNPTGERLQQLAASWQKTVQEVGNGDDAMQRLQSAWLDHQRRYAEVVSVHQKASGEAARQFGEELARAQREAWDKACQQYAAYLGQLQQAVTQAGAGAAGK